jgi:hypoxanthine phosphoribosyltransferase
MTESPIDPSIEPLFQADEIEREVLDLGRRLAGDLSEEDPLFLSLLSGSVIFLADLVRAYESPVRYEFVQVAYHHPEIAAAELLEIQYPIAFDIADQNLVVVKDVVSTGVTENYLAQQFLQKGARSVRFAALIDLPDERRTELEVLYRAFSLKRTSPLVGYGLKHEGRYGNLPYIGRLEGGD